MFGLLASQCSESMRCISIVSASLLEMGRVVECGGVFHKASLGHDKLAW